MGKNLCGLIVDKQNSKKFGLKGLRHVVAPIEHLGTKFYLFTTWLRGTVGENQRGAQGPWTTSIFDNQSRNIVCVGKLGHLSGFLRHYLLNSFHKSLFRDANQLICVLV